MDQQQTDEHIRVIKQQLDDILKTYGESPWWTLVEPDEINWQSACAGVFCVEGDWIDGNE